MVPRFYHTKKPHQYPVLSNQQTPTVAPPLGYINSTCTHASRTHEPMRCSMNDTPLPPLYAFPKKRKNDNAIASRILPVFLIRDPVGTFNLQVVSRDTREEGGSMMRWVSVFNFLDKWERSIRQSAYTRAKDSGLLYPQSRPPGGVFKPPPPEESLR